MRHRQRGRHLGRTSPHRKALRRNMACSLILTERDPEFYEGLFQADGKTEVRPPRQTGRIVTTWHKAKDVRPFVEKCITIARRALPHQEQADEFDTDADRNSEEWNQWRQSEEYRKWNEAVAPVVAARRRVFAMLRDHEAVRILFDEIAPRYADRPGGYTRILRLAKPRLGDAGQQAILEFVGTHDRQAASLQAPVFDDTDEELQDELQGESDEARHDELEDSGDFDDELDPRSSETDSDDAENLAEQESPPGDSGDEDPESANDKDR